MLNSAVGTQTLLKGCVSSVLCSVTSHQHSSSSGSAGAVQALLPPYGAPLFPDRPKSGSFCLRFGTDPVPDQDKNSAGRCKEETKRQRRRFQSNKHQRNHCQNQDPEVNTGSQVKMRTEVIVVIDFMIDLVAKLGSKLKKDKMYNDEKNNDPNSIDSDNITLKIIKEHIASVVRLLSYVHTTLLSCQHN